MWSSKRRKTEYVLLGLLADGPKSGYEMKKIIEVSISHFWQESFGQIYPALSRLAKEKLVRKKKVEQINKPDKDLYSLTPAGKKHFLVWLSLPAERRPERNELLLKLFFGGLASPQDSVRMVERYCQESKEAARFFRNIEKAVKEEDCAGDAEGGGAPENSTYSMLTLMYGIMLHEMQARWAEKAIEVLQNVDSGK